MDVATIGVKENMSEGNCFNEASGIADLPQIKAFFLKV